MKRRAFCISAAGAIGAAALNTNLSEMPTARVREAYGGNYERLLSVKRKYDSANLFRLNANIDPRGGTPA
jgi:hypothetical protein